MELSIVTIGAFVGLMNQGTKYIATNFVKKDISRLIPILSVIYGIILGIIGYLTKSTDMGTTLINAIFIGASAGGSSVACHQTFKQLTKPSQQTDENDK